MQDEDYMRRAISLACRGSGYVSPNPMVGAVLVHNNRIIGEGWHARYGKEHAEVACLQSVAAADAALISESTMYVSLEPCAHHGKQPPCANRLVSEGIRRVVIASEDPNPRVNGRGISILKDAGIDVTIGCCAEEGQWLARRFLTVQQAGRPYIILKWAQSADGYIAPADGTPFQLSNHFSLTLTHRWRTEESAILVGYNTALADDPSLTARLWDGPNPLRIALDRNAGLPPTHHLLDGSTATWIINEQLEREGITGYRKIAFDDNLIPELLRQLKDAGKNSLIVEGGAKLLRSFITAGLWDEARVFLTPTDLGEGIAAPLLKDSILVHSTMVNDDMLQISQPASRRFPYPAGAQF